MDKDLKKRFLGNTEETGRYIVTSLVTGRKYFVEPVGSERPADWGSYNPGTGNIEHKKGYGKYAGAVPEKESMITEENGFSNIKEIRIGESISAEIDRRDKEYEKKIKGEDK